MSDPRNEVLAVLRQCLNEQEDVLTNARQLGTRYILRSAPGLYLRCYQLTDWPFCFKPVQIQDRPTEYTHRKRADDICHRITNQFGDKAEVVTLEEAARIELDRTQELIDIIEGRKALV